MGAAVTPVPQAGGVTLVPLGGDYAAYRQRVIFECCKWDPQVGDHSTISDHAAVLDQRDAAYLGAAAEQLAAETIAMEQALAERRDLHHRIGLPWRLGARLKAPPAQHVRVVRFDFHPTAAGWRISEVNSDVPGGYAEASQLPVIAAEYTGAGLPAADTAQALVRAIGQRIGEKGRIAFVHATAYTDDRQVMQYLARRFVQAGHSTALLAPDHLRFDKGRAHSIADAAPGPVDAIVRFYPAEWLPLLPRRSGWPAWFGAATPMANPPGALLSQSKRLPLAWDALGVAVPAWRTFLPETRDPRDAPWRTDDSWLLKPAFGRVGEDIAWRSSGPAKDWRALARAATGNPGRFIAQKRFEPLALPTRDGPKNLCVGVFTVDGRAAGFYGRLSSGAVIDKHAQDIAVLVSSPATERRHVA